MTGTHRYPASLWAFVVAVGLALPVAALGCGCFYGEATEVDVFPETECLDLHANGACAWLGLGGTNHCEDIFTLTPLEEGEVITVGPEESFELKDVTPYADMETDDAYCVTWVEVEAELGGRELAITFEVERINRGLRLPCD